MARNSVKSGIACKEWLGGHENSNSINCGNPWRGAWPMNSVLKCFSQGAVNLHHSYLAFGTPNAFGQTHPQWPRASLHVMFWAARLTGTHVRLVHSRSTPALTNAQYSQEHYTWSPNSCRVTAPLMSSINQCCPPNHHVMLANMPDQPPQRTPHL